MEKFICLPCYCLYVYYSREEVKYSVVLCEVGGQIFIPYVSSVCLRPTGCTRSIVHFYTALATTILTWQ